MSDADPVPRRPAAFASDAGAVRAMGADGPGVRRKGRGTARDRIGVAHRQASFSG